MRWFIGSLFFYSLFLLWRWRMNKARLIMARTIYGEARGEGWNGMVAVAYVILNRAALGGWWGDSIISVAQKPWQFSAWNEGDPNRAVIENLKPGDSWIFDKAYEIAGLVIGGDIEDPTGGATNYHTLEITPAWADPSKQVAVIGNHIFYEGIV